MVISLDIVRRVRLFYSCLSVVHYYITITVTQQVTHSILSWLVAMMFCLGLLSSTASCNSYKPLMVSGTECVGIEVMLKYFAEDKANKNN